MKIGRVICSEKQSIRFIRQFKVNLGCGRNLFDSEVVPSLQGKSNAVVRQGLFYSFAAYRITISIGRRNLYRR